MRPVPPALFGLPADTTDFLSVNPAEKFVTAGRTRGSPAARSSPNTYGGAASHGGGAFSGKDPTKFHCSAAYAARYVAKNIVATGPRRPLPAIGDVCDRRRPSDSVNLDCFRFGNVAFGTIERLIEEHFDFSPGAILREPDLRRPIYAKTAASRTSTRVNIS